MKHILLVEDEEMLVNVLATVLEEEGFSVRKSTSAEEALTVMPGFNPDLIISDIRLEKLDGFSMLEQVRKRPTRPDIPFICLTALDDTSSQQRARNLGATAYVTKPFDVDDLLKIVKKVLT